MSTEMREFSSLSDFIKFVDGELAELRRSLGELLRVLEDVRAKAEQDKKLRELLSKLTGASGAQPSPPVVDLRGLKVAINPSAEVELGLLEQLVEALNTKITQLQAIRKEIEVLGGTDIEASVKAIIIDGVPRALIIKVS
ncbi:MAG: hypothetical protein DRO39_03580 [Thermoprotei archaeon]|nr:MAG: hypothetical protein DRO39_03580 [Thermoprotei archaeon]